MNCQKIKKLLNPYIDKTLDVNTAKQINEHLKSCAACREEHLKLKKIISTLNSISTQTAPADFTQNIMAKISQEEIQIQSSWMDRIKSRISIPSLSFPPLLLSFPRKWESIFSFRLAGIATITALIVFFAFTFIFNTPDTSLICSAEVQFSLKINDNKAHTVAIAGDFNGWNPQANILEDPEGDGIWTGTLNLEPGRYEYMFVMDGEKWFPDPNALRYVKDGFGNKNAILEINNCNST
ncbi:MAG: zf-HC2 domain-containing protein [Atribacterota bacterium]